jgi:hypothetical protein
MENEIPAGSRASNLYWTRTEQLRSRRSDSGPDACACTLSRGAGQRLEAYATLRLGPNVAQASSLYWICTKQLRSRRSDSAPDAWRPDFESGSRTQAGSLWYTANLA